MKRRISPSRYRPSISDVIVRHWNWHVLVIICVCIVAQKSLLAQTVGVDAMMIQVEGSECLEITDVKDVTRALTDIVEWKELGYELGVPDITIKSIENDEKGINNQRRAMLRAWYNLQIYNPCWRTVTDTLNQLGQKRLAVKIEQCAECMESGSDCNFATCMKIGVNKCDCAYSISVKSVSIGLMAVLGVLVLLCLYFSYRILRQVVRNWLMSRSTTNLPQHQLFPRVQQRALILKDPPFLRYNGPLATAKYHEIAQHFEKLYSPSNYEQIKKFAQNIVNGSHIELDLKAFALCWEASSEIFLREQHEVGERLLRAAWEKASPMECKNGLLLQGMIHRLFAAMYYIMGAYGKASEHISAAEERLCNAAPSKETALILYRKTVVKLQERLRDKSADNYESIENNFDLLLEHANYLEDYENPYIFLFRMEKAKFHLRTLLISNKLPSEEYWPTQLDLKKAKNCLERVSLEMLPSEVSFYAVNFYIVHCDLCLWNEQYPEAMAYVKKAKQLFPHEKSETLTTRRFNERLKLLEQDEEIDKILKKFDVVK